MEEMRVSNEKFTSYYNSGDMKAVSELYTEDCKAMPQGKEVQEGRKGIINSRRKEKKRYIHVAGQAMPKNKHIAHACGKMWFLTSWHAVSKTCYTLCERVRARV